MLGFEASAHSGRDLQVLRRGSPAVSGRFSIRRSADPSADPYCGAMLGLEAHASQASGSRFKRRALNFDSAENVRLQTDDRESRFAAEAAL